MVKASSKSFDLVGLSPQMRAVRAFVQLASQSASSTVLITGETGTGKELVARSIHAASARASAPLVSINCGAFTETLLDSELFGYVRGAFTGATANRQGLFTSADKGTIFLDELGEMSAATQVRLLRVLQERRVRPVGAPPGQELPVEARVIAATNRDLEREVEAGAFRSDLYYRVNVLRIHLPPLRERADDIPALCQALTQKLRAAGVWPPRLTLSPAAVDALSSHGWPGNVRELENILERVAVRFADHTRVSARDVESVFPVTVRALQCGAPAGFEWYQGEGYQETCDRLMRELISLALDRSGGNKSAAARLLKLERRQLYYHLGRLRLQRPRRRACANSADEPALTDVSGGLHLQTAAFD